MKKSPQGYIALISVLLISTALILAVVSLSFTGYLNRFVILDAQLKEESLAYAEACASQVVGEIAKNKDFVADYYPYPVSVNGVSSACTIESITPPAASRIIITKSIVQKATTKIEVTLNSSTASVLSWNEIP
jgi:hypothetical protein